MQNKISYWYGVKHWLLTLVIAPVLVILLGSLFSGTASEFNFGLMIVVSMYFVVFGFLLSLPTCLAYAIANLFLIMGEAPFKIMKIVLSGVAIVGLMLTWVILAGFEGDMYIPIVYTIIIVLTGWLIPIQKKSKSEEEVLP